MFVGAPLLLGSAYGVLAGLALAVLRMVRILGEETMLVENWNATGTIPRMYGIAFFPISGSIVTSGACHDRGRTGAVYLPIWRTSREHGRLPVSFVTDTVKHI